MLFWTKLKFWIKNDCYWPTDERAKAIEANMLKKELEKPDD